MRGLINFIKELRECRLREQEERRILKELANIRSKFADSSSLDAYSRRKYVAKLIYIYILGYTVDFGHLEIITLLTSRSYFDKQIGYLGVTTLLENKEDLSDVLLECIRRDLDDLNETTNCLALNAIANVCNKQMASTFCPEIYKMMIGTPTNKAVRKKAILCIMRFYRKFPDIVLIQDWYSRIITLIDTYDLSISHATASLLLTISQRSPEYVIDGVPRIIQKLYKIVVDEAFGLEHVYYNIPSPWIQIKLLQLLAALDIPNDPGLRNRLIDILKRILSFSTKILEGKTVLQQENVVKAILFEAIKVTIRYNIQEQLVDDAFKILSSFITSQDINTRYLALDTLTSVNNADCQSNFMKTHQENIFACLRDKDISIRKRALGLLYATCNVENAKFVIRELIEFLKVAEINIQNELVLRIAILAETNATALSWYFEVILQLIQYSSQEIFPSDICFRAIQVIVNHAELQEFAVISCYQTLSASPPNVVNEALLKLSGYILGEYAELLRNIASPLDVFKMFQSRFDLCSSSCKALLLTTYLKLAFKFPEIQEYIIPVFRIYKTSIHSELQQRSSEYLNLISKPENRILLEAVCQSIPAFDESAKSLVLVRLEQKMNSSNDEYLSPVTKAFNETSI